MNGMSGEIQRKFFKDVLRRRFRKGKNVLHKASGKMRKLAVERRKVKADAGSLTRLRLFWRNEGYKRRGRQ